MKMFGLASLAAVVAMAFIGASSASALKPTQLCKTHTSLVCGSALTNFNLSLKTGTVGTLLNEVANVLCLTVGGTAEALALGNPQLVHGTNSFTNCGTTATHNNCTITVEEQPLFHLLKTALDAGLLLALTGKTRVKCTIFGFIKLDCLYSAAGLEFEVEGGNPAELTAENTPVEFISGSGLCPEESTLDGTLVSSTELHILE